MSTEGEPGTDLAAFERLVSQLTHPRVYAVAPTTLLDVAVPPELLAIVAEEVVGFLVSDLEPVDHALTVTCFERARRLGMAQVDVHFQGVEQSTLLTIVDLTSVLGVLAYVFSNDVAPPVVPAELTAGHEVAATASVVLTPGGKIVEVHGTIPGVVDVEIPGFVGSSLGAYVHPDDAPAALHAFAEALTDHRIGRRLRARVRTVDGDWRWMESNLYAGAQGADGEVYVSCSLTDVEADVRARAALAESEDRFRNLAESIPVGVFETTTGAGLHFANETFRHITGVDTDLADWPALAHPDDLVSVSEALAAFGVDGDVLDIELRILPMGAADYRTVHVMARGIRAEDGTLRGSVGSMEDITSRKAMQVRLAHDASHDGLTGLANRAHLVEELGRRLASSHSGRDPLAVLFVDLNGFKRVNDSLGHSAGDDLLLLLAERLQGEARSDDLVSRFGGDEFVLVSEQTGGPDGALGMAHRVLEALSAPAEVAGVVVRPRASIGVAIATDANTDPETLLRDADAAMYEAKARGPNGVWLADAAVRGRANRRFGLEGAIADSFLSGQYRLDYQPIVQLSTLRVVGAEGLLRWDSPEFGVVPPGEIIPLAEETGLIHQLTDWTVGRAGRDQLTLAGIASGKSSVPLGINLSCAQLSSPTFLSRYLAAIEAAGVAPGDLIVEVTETELIEESSAAGTALAELADLGVQLAIDDFGSGYSSFDYLTRMPVTYLKIDRQLTRQLPTNQRARRVLRGLASMCRDMGIDVIAEGIETAVERDAYLEIGIEVGQGYLFARAMSIDALAAALQHDTLVTP